MSTANDMYRNEVKERYSFSSWAEKSKEAQAGPYKECSISEEGIHGLALLDKHHLPRNFRERRSQSYRLSPKDKTKDFEELFLVDLQECGSIEDAHENLIDTLMGCMSTRLPDLEDDIGDIAFGSHGDIQTSILFVRNNVVASVRSIGKKDVSVVETARVIDTFIRGEEFRQATIASTY
jgi:hypothetical protein